MERVYLKKIINKKVMGNDGSEIGTLKNVTAELETGDLSEMVVHLNENSSGQRRYRAEGGYIYIPFSSLRSIRDYIVVDVRSM
ncbi:MAG: PRC-barrel domain-containing protein [Archaeoglobi archaeon]|nr:PRC-barrel domain-containing protein [Candidatus Mnemosynella sp.]MBC7115128.1 PRC-barrel domain-containing protein [Candidatus Mnemosynella bozhongmuii]